jgi:hypothetical protein
MRIDGEHNRLINNVLALTTNLVRQKIYGLLDLVEVCELLVRYLIKLGPGLDIFCRMIQTELEWTPCNDTVTSRQEVETDNGLEYRRLSG